MLSLKFLNVKESSKGKDIALLFGFFCFLQLSWFLVILSPIHNESANWDLIHDLISHRARVELDGTQVVEQKNIGDDFEEFFLGIHELKIDVDLLSVAL